LIFDSKEAFKQIFLEYYNPLCNFANNITNDESLSEDIVQDVFLKLWESNDSISLTGSLRSYLFQTTKNKVLEKLRNLKAQSKLHERIDQTQIQSLDHDELSETYMRLEQLYNSLRHLPPKCREVFAMHKFNGLTYAEIADAEDISIKTVENHMLKAIKILREKLVK